MRRKRVASWGPHGIISTHAHCPPGWLLSAGAVWAGRSWGDVYGMVSVRVFAMVHAGDTVCVGGRGSHMACLGCFSTGDHITFQAVSPQIWAVPPSAALCSASTLAPGPESQCCLLRFMVELRRALPVLSSISFHQKPVPLFCLLLPVTTFGTRYPNLQKAASKVTFRAHISNQPSGM